MIARDVRARSGITLTEILIAILIMGVGLISLATLFPLGLLRLREATRGSRSGLLYESAADDMDTRALLFKPSFTQTWYWGNNNGTNGPRDPFVQDALPPNNTINGIIASNPYSPNGVIPGTQLPLLQSGLPFCYDPLWRSITNVMPNTVPTASGLMDQSLSFSLASVNNVTPDEARFGAAIFSNGSVGPSIRPTDPDGNAPSAHGLQRLTNFIPWATPTLIKTGTILSYQPLNFQYPFTSPNASLSSTNQPADVSGLVFASNDDIVFNPFTGNPNTPSPLLPDMSVNNTPQADYRFTWFITGRQSDAGGDGSQFAGEVVVCDGRTFGWDQIPGQSYNAPAGETAVEAVFGFGGNVSNLPDVNGKATGLGFATGASRTVLLRWPSTFPDPQVRVGGWICDVTYERIVSRYASRAFPANSAFTNTPYARCNWYQIGKRTEPQADVLIPGSGYRSIVLTLTSPVKTQTLLDSTSGLPIHVNVALVMPSVVNVFPRAFEVIPISIP